MLTKWLWNTSTGQLKNSKQNSQQKPFVREKREERKQGFV
jgi:hypothetical protein